MKIKLLIAGIVLAIVAVFLYFLISGTSKASAFSVIDGNLEIKGAFGVTVPVKDMVNLKLADEMPAVDKKTNGSGLGTVYKGSFNLKDSAKARLYADASKPPFITFKQGDTVFYINAETAEETRDLFNQLTAAQSGTTLAPG